MLLVAPHTGHTSTAMSSAVVILSMVAAIAAEAPYHLPRPAAHAPSFSYPPAPAPAPHPHPHHHHHPHPHPPPQFIQYPPQPAPTPQFIQGSGYHYQQPNIAPAFVQPAPQPHHHVYPHPPPPPPPQPLPIKPYPQQQYAQPPPQPIPQSPPGYTYAQPAPAPRPAPVQPAPLPAYIAPQPAPAAVPLPTYIAPQPAPAAVPLPTYIAPQPAPAAVPLPVYIAPQSAPLAPQPVSHYQPQIQQGYTYQQPQIQYVPQLPQPAQPLQTQPLTNNVATSPLSSYQADTNQYSSASIQSHGEALDATVVDRVQNIIKENEHTSARDAGYLSLVSGVSLEQARPSIEISSFIHNSPLQTSVNSEHGAIEQPSSHQLSPAPAAASALSQDYGLPTVPANTHASAPDSQPDAALSFLPQNKPATSYGSPQ